MKTVGDLKKQLEQFSDTTPLLFTLGDGDEVCTSRLFEGDHKEAWFYFMLGKQSELDAD